MAYTELSIFFYFFITQHGLKYMGKETVDRSMWEEMSLFS